MQRNMGALLSPPDPRDYAVQAVRGLILPSRYDLRPQQQPIRNQGAEGTCVSHAIASGAMGHQQKIKPSPSAAYNRTLGVRTLYELAREEAKRNLRPILGEGCHVRDALKAAFRDGIDLETDCPYVPHQPKARGAYSSLHQSQNKVGSYAAVSPGNVPLTKDAILRYGGALTVIQAYGGFMTPDSYGNVKPTGSENGLHAIYLCGWDDSISSYIIRNSWGPDWGLGGYALMPYAYEQKESWVITASLNSNTPPPSTRPSWWPWWMPWIG